MLWDTGSPAFAGDDDREWLGVSYPFPSSLAKSPLERDGFELNRRRCFVHLAPLAGRGRIALAIRVRGTLRAFSIRGGSPSPQPSPREERGAGEVVPPLQPKLIML